MALASKSGKLAASSKRQANDLSHSRSSELLINPSKLPRKSHPPQLQKDSP